jgi:hypothetical protein
MKKVASIIAGLLIFASFAVIQANAAELPSAPTPQDSYAFHRGEDFAFGGLIAMPVGIATKPAIGFWAAEAAGIANEARYKGNFNVGHLAVITTGAGVGYGLAKWEKHVAARNRVKYGQ